MKSGTLNVRGTIEAAKLKHLINEIRKQKFDVVALQETKQKGNFKSTDVKLKIWLLLALTFKAIDIQGYMEISRWIDYKSN